MKTSTEKGRDSEELAKIYLEQHGLTLIERNFRCRLGEIDLIMEDRGQLVFVEVRSRKNDLYGHALDTIDMRKRQRLQRTAQVYLQTGKGKTDRDCRFDVVAITTGKPAIEWIKDAIFE